MKFRDDLKIQLRAVPYAHDSKVLEYRIDPNQDLKYLEDEKETSWFGFVSKIVKKVHKYPTYWIQPRVYANNLTGRYYDFDDDFNWGPIWCEDKSTLEWYKGQFKTYGDIRKYLENKRNKSYTEWKESRDHYLKSREIIY